MIDLYGVEAKQMTTENCTDGHGWGKVNRGQSWHILAVDLDRAFAHARLSDYERMLLQFIREQSWGRQARRKLTDGTRASPDGVALVLTALAEAWRVPRPKLSQAKSRLVARRILLAKDGLLWINKDVDEWAELLRPASLIYAREAQAQRIQPDTETVSKQVRARIQTGTRAVPTEVRAPSPNGYARVSKQEQCTCAVKEARAELNSDEERLKKTPEEGEERATPNEESCAPIPGGSTPDPAEVKRVAHWAESASCSLAFGADVGRACWVWGTDWTEEAARRCIARGRYSGDYLRGILRKWQAQGGPDVEPTNGSSCSNGEPVLRPTQSELRRRQLHASILEMGEQWRREEAENGTS